MEYNLCGLFGDGQMAPNDNPDIEKHVMAEEKSRKEYEGYKNIYCEKYQNTESGQVFYFISKGLSSVYRLV